MGVRVGDAPRLLPGVLAAAALVLAAEALVRVGGDAVLRAQGLDPASPQARNPLSPVMAAVVLGLLVGNLVRVPRAFAPGADFAAKRLLRLGIMALGVKLSLFEALKLGAGALPAVFGVVAAGLWVVPWVARRLGLGDRLGQLAAASTSICGVSATLAVAPVVEADERETAITVANVTLFGLVAMFVHPWIAHAVFADSPGSAGLFLGTAIHDTSQVTGAAAVYAQLYAEPRAQSVAVVAKLVRNLCLVGVVPLLAARHARSGRGEGRASSRASLVPWFIVGFVAAAALRSLGDYGLAEGGRALGSFDAAEWRAATHAVGDGAATRLLAAAMAAVGLQTRFATLRGLGARPFVLGGAAAALVSLVGLGLAALCGPFVG